MGGDSRGGSVDSVGRREAGRAQDDAFGRRSGTLVSGDSFPIRPIRDGVPIKITIARSHSIPLITPSPRSGETEIGERPGSSRRHFEAGFAFLGSSAGFTYLNSTGPCPKRTMSAPAFPAKA